MTRSCPDCGASLEDPLVVGERLSDLGYAHRDRRVECPECPRTVTFGHPVDPETDQAPTCAVCGGRTYPYKLDFHRVRERFGEMPDHGHIVLRDDPVEALRVLDVHWKCEDCHYFHSGVLDHLTADVYSLGVDHLEGRRDDA